MPDKNKIVGINPMDPDPGIISRAGKIIRKKGVVIFPAKCLCGVAADALDEASVQKVYDLKNRPLDKPILALIPSEKSLTGLVQSIPARARKLMDAFWPGNLTLVFSTLASCEPVETSHYIRQQIINPTTHRQIINLIRRIISQFPEPIQENIKKTIRDHRISK